MTENRIYNEPTPRFAVVIEGEMSWPGVFGPFTDREDAERFAAFATAEIDPARVVPLLSPVAELLNWRDMTKEGSHGHPF